MIAVLADTAQAAAEAAAQGITFMQAWEWGGWVMWVLAALSTAAFALVLYLLVAQRTGALAPRTLVFDVCDAARKGDAETVRRLVERTPCAFADLAFAAAEAASGPSPESTPERVRQALESAGAHIAERLNMTVEYLLDVASIAPLVGLLGTVLGMFRAFGAVASDIASAKPVALAQGVTQALVTTVFGLALSIPVLAAYAFLRRRAARRVALLEAAGEDVAAAFAMASVRRPAAQQTPGGQPPAARTSPAPAQVRGTGNPELDAETLGRMLGAAK